MLAEARAPAFRPEAFQRFHLAMQRSRAAVMLTMTVVAVMAKLAGQLTVTWPAIGAAMSIGTASALLFHELYRRGRYAVLGLPLSACWMAVDILVISWTIYASGDRLSLWLIWYVTNTAAAAFVGGWRPALTAASFSCLCYLGTLVLLGKIRGLDAELTLALSRLLLLYGSTAFLVRGIVILRERRLEIGGLHDEMKQRVEELSRLTAELDRRGRELAQANVEIHEANRVKSQFLANMSHELRTPLNSIIGFSEILTEKLQPSIEPRFHRFLANILTSGRHLLTLINDILDLSKIEAGKMELQLEPVSVADVVHSVDSVMHGFAAKHAVTVVAAVPRDLPLVIADPPRVKQILYNLVSNAVKFSPAGGTVRIAARALEAAESPLAAPAVELSVEDHGVGIRPEDQALIFEEFRQLDGGPTRNLGGTGLGLSLVKSFVDLHGGRIAVESEPGRGSLFRVVLPLRPAAASVGGQPGTDAAGDAPPVLVIEDDDEFYAVLAADLEAAGFRVRRARDGEEGLQAARAERPAAITLDLVLPRRDGWEVLKELKADAGLAAVPVVIVSLVANHELGFALGADDYFLKPLDRRLFLGRMRELVATTAAADAPSVLLVDDDPQVHDLLGLELRDQGFRVASAGSARAAVEQAVARPPAIIVLDLMMPGIDGFAAAAELRARPETAHIPIVVYTAKDPTAEERRRLLGRVNAVVSKAPADRRRLLETIRELLARRRGGAA